MIVSRPTSLVPLAISLVLLAACDRPTETATSRHSTKPASVAPDKAGAGKSIMRPAVQNEAPVEPKVTPAPITADIAFAFGRSDLDERARSQIEALLASPGFAVAGPIVLRGNTDALGSDRLNQKVAERRARAVGDYMLEHGVPQDRLIVLGLGERRPIAPSARPDGSDDPEGRARDRHVAVTVGLTGDSSIQALQR